jgi:membrane-associated phospholipid phosphatase
MKHFRKPASRTEVRLLSHIEKKIALALLLAGFGCLPARGQSAGNLTLRQAMETPASRFRGNLCFLTPRQLCTGPVSVDPPTTQTPASKGALKKAVERFGKDQVEIYSAPFHGSNLKWDGLFLAGTGVFIATDRRATRDLSNDHANISRDISNAGLYGTSAVAAAFWLSGVATHNEHARETGILSAEAFANSAPFYGAVQLLAGRERPNEGTGNGRFWRNNALNSSFPSAHALFTWSMASVIAHEYPRTWVKVLVYGTATAVSVTRFSGREHFPSDVVVGSVIGYLIGRHIFQAHCKEGLSEDCHSAKIFKAAGTLDKP